MTQEEEITRNLSLIEYYKEQLNSLEMQSQFLQTAIADYQKGKLTIEHLKKTDKDSEILIPMGGGTFLNGIVKDVSNVLVDIGAGYVTEKNLEDAIKKIDQRIVSLQENQERLFSLMQKLQTEANELSQKTQGLIDQSQQ